MTEENHIPEERFEQIERFLQHEMSADEEQKFMESLEQDPSLREQVGQMRLILLGIQESTLRGKLEEFHKDTAVTKVKHLYNAKWLLAAAVIAGLSLGAWWLIRSASGNERLFAQYFRPDPGLISSMGSSEDYAFDRAMVDYKTGHYADAIRTWKGLQSSNPSSDTLNYFLGSAYLALKDGDAAVTYLQKVVTDDNSVFKEEANWYLGLSLLLENKIQEAVPYLKNSDHKEKEKLLSTLKQ